MSEIDRLARRIVKLEKLVAAGQRPRQLPASSVSDRDGTDRDLSVAIEQAADTASDLEVTTSVVDDHDEAVDDSADHAIEVAGWVNAAVTQAGTAFELAVISNSRVGEALTSAEAAAIVAASASETARGSARYRLVDGGEIEPDLPEDGPGVGAELTHFDTDGHPYQVDVWNGTGWARAQYLADQLLVLDPDGTVQIANATVISPRVIGAEFEGGRFTGGEFIQYASTDQALIYPDTAGDITVADWAGGAPDGWGDAEESTSVYESGGKSAYVSRTGAGSLSLLWMNNDRTPASSVTPRSIRLVVRATAAVTGVHVTTGAGTREVDDLPADTWVTIDVDLDDDESLEWVHLGVVTTGTATLYVDTLGVAASALDGAHMRIARSVTGLPGIFIVNGDSEIIGSFTPLGLETVQPGGVLSGRLNDGVLTLEDATPSDERMLEVGPDGIDSTYGLMGRVWAGTTTQRTALAASGRARAGDRFVDEDTGREYTYSGDDWRTVPITKTGSITITPSAANVATSAAVTFPAGLFPDTPEVTDSVSSPLARSGVSGISTSGFTATIIRSNTTNTVFKWDAQLD